MIIAGHSLVQNLRRGRYELAIDTPSALRVAVAFTELWRANRGRRATMLFAERARHAKAA